MKTINKKLCGIMAILLLILPISSVCVYADEIDDPESGYIADDCVRLTDNSFYGGSTGMESSYDPRTKNLSTDIKDQGNTQLCWMFSTVATEEQFAMKKYGKKLNISEIHGAAAMSDCVINLENNQEYESYLPGIYTNSVNVPGTTSIALQYLTNWNSPICSTDIFKWNSNVSNEDYPNSIMETDYNFIYHNFLYLEDYDYAFSNSGSVVNLTDTKFISKDKNTVKRAIRDYAAVNVEIYMDKTYLSKNGSVQSYYSNFSSSSDTRNINHAVTIVGWDDDYPKENFKSSNRPSNDGAWLVRNSWKKGDVNPGYIWVSYEEQSFLVNTNNFGVITGLKKPSDREYMLSYDYLPLKANNNSADSTVYMANIYDVSSYQNEYSEINQVMFYRSVQNCTYNIRIIPIEDNLPTDISNYSILSTGQISGEGYTTANLSTPYSLNDEYEKYAIVVEFVPNNSDSLIYLPAEVSEYRDTTSSHLGAFEINDNESLYYVDEDGAEQIEWIDNKYKHKYNNGGSFCIRPVLHKTTTNSHYSSLSPTQINNHGSDIVININSDSPLFNIHDSANRVLYEDVDYTINDNNVTILSSYVNAVGIRNTTLYFEFNNELTKTVVINKKATLSSVSISGVPLVGDTLTSTLTCTPSRDHYDVDYQWQNSSDGITWTDIPNATDPTYVLSSEDFLKYVRVTVSAHNNGNVIYPKTKSSSATYCKVVILGDVDLNGNVNIEDATCIQCYCVNIIQLSDEQMLAADVDRDGMVTIDDATAIQKELISK